MVLTHGNLLANLEPIENEIEKYRKYERFVHPLKLLDLLPLSHVFGQLLGIFIPQVIGATTVFLDTLNPAEVTRTIRNERVSLLVTVPRLIESLRDHVERDMNARGRREKYERDVRASAGEHFLKRWWRFRAIHRKLGWRFWAIVSGGAALPAAAEQFWDRLGYAVIQGYGLTETTSLVSLNHPFRLGKGSIGKTLPGLEVRLADDGEILVRGENVASGYWKDAGVTSVLDADGWFRTGDLGERDAKGNLYFKGRQKNVIVTPEGLNVFPQDLEAELRKEAGVRDCVVVGLARDGNAEPCAVVLMREGADEDAAAADAVRAANGRLAAFQQMRRWMVWPEEDFPRTPTQKPMLGRIRQAAEARFGAGAASVVNSVTNAATSARGALAEIFARVSHGRELPDGAGGSQLSSVERVELLSALEDRYQVDLSETEFAAADSVRELARLVEQPAVAGRGVSVCALGAVVAGARVPIRAAELRGQAGDADSGLAENPRTREFARSSRPGAGCVEPSDLSRSFLCAARAARPIASAVGRGDGWGAAGVDAKTAGEPRSFPRADRPREVLPDRFYLQRVSLAAGGGIPEKFCVRGRFDRSRVERAGVSRGRADARQQDRSVSRRDRAAGGTAESAGGARASRGALRTADCGQKLGAAGNRSAFRSAHRCDLTRRRPRKRLRASWKSASLRWAICGQMCRHRTHRGNVARAFYDTMMRGNE